MQEPNDNYRELQDRVGLYKLQVEELDKHYDGMRTLLWRVTVQVYAVYVVIPIALSRLDQEFHSWQLGALAIISTIVLYLCASYSSFRIVVRLIYYGEMSKAYLSAIHNALKVPDLAKPDQIPHLGQPYLWTHIVQRVLSITIILGLLDYEVALERLLPANWIVPATVLVSLCMTAGLILSVRVLKQVMCKVFEMAERVRGLDDGVQPRTEKR